MLSLTYTHTYWSGFKKASKENEQEEKQELPAAALHMTTPSFRAKEEDDGGNEEAKHGDGDTKNAISSSHSRLLVQYGSGISGDWRSKSL